MITIVTSNSNKRDEICQILGITDLGIAKVELTEIQSMDLGQIIRSKAKAAYQIIQAPIVVEDVSLELDAMGGLPGPFVKFWEERAGYDNTVIYIMGVGTTRARVRCAAAYFDGSRLIEAEAVHEGRMVTRRGEKGWGFDFYFVPDGQTGTYSELGREWKNQHGHRAAVYRALWDKLKNAGVIKDG